MMKLLIPILIYVVVSSGFVICAGRYCPIEAASLKWQTLETRYVKLYYESPEALRKFDANIKYEKPGQTFSFFGSNRDDDRFETHLKEKIDALYVRVQSILDMRKAMKKVKVKIYPDQKNLWDAYKSIYKKEEQLRAWYIFEYHTVYVCNEDLNEGMLAHEIAHAVIDNYLNTRPPAATAEILARYVDKHLIEEW